jgi:hypothetical protein
MDRVPGVTEVNATADAPEVHSEIPGGIQIPAL